MANLQVLSTWNRNLSRPRLASPIRLIVAPTWNASTNLFARVKSSLPSVLRFYLRKQKACPIQHQKYTETSAEAAGRRAVTAPLGRGMTSSEAERRAGRQPAWGGTELGHVAQVPGLGHTALFPVLRSSLAVPPPPCLCSS